LFFGIGTKAELEGIYSYLDPEITEEFSTQKLEIGDVMIVKKVTSIGYLILKR
jgi:hypothetical protein